MSQLFLLNIGNTHVSWVRAEQAADGGWALIGESCGRCDTGAWLDGQCELPAVPGLDVWAACVVPLAKDKLTSSGYGQSLHWVCAADAVSLGLDLSAMDTSTLGADRIANAAALFKYYPLPAANFDCGTAITMEVVLADGKFSGGAIAPGRKLLRKALALGTAALPELPLSHEAPRFPGCNTLDALAFGIDRGAVGIVREWIASVRMQEVKTLIASGGDADYFCRALPVLELVGSELTMRGILALALAARG